MVPVVLVGRIDRIVDPTTVVPPGCPGHVRRWAIEGRRDRHEHELTTAAFGVECVDHLLRDPVRLRGECSHGAACDVVIIAENAAAPQLIVRIAFEVRVAQHHDLGIGMRPIPDRRQNSPKPGCIVATVDELRRGIHVGLAVGGLPGRPDEALLHDLGELGVVAANREQDHVVVGIDSEDLLAAFRMSRRRTVAVPTRHPRVDVDEIGARRTRTGFVLDHRLHTASFQQPRELVAVIVRVLEAAAIALVSIAAGAAEPCAVAGRVRIADDLDLEDPVRRRLSFRHRPDGDRNEHGPHQ